MRLLAILLLFQIVATLFAAQNNIIDILQEKIKSSPPKNLYEASKAAYAVKKAGIDVASYNKVFCKPEFKFSESSTLDEIYDALILKKVMDCEHLVVPESFTEVMKSFYEENPSEFTPKMYFQFSQLLVLFSKSFFSDLAEETDFLKKMFKDVDQYLKKEDGYGLVDRSYMFESALPLAKVIGGKGQMSSVVKIQKKSIGDLFSLRYFDDLDAIMKTSAAIIKLGTTLKKKVPEDRINEIMKWVYEKADFGKMNYEELSTIVLFLSSIDGYQSYNPIRVLADVKFTKGEKYEFFISDIFGAPVKSEDANLDIFFADDVDEAFLDDLALTKTPSGSFELGLSQIEDDGESKTNLLLVGEGVIIFELTADGYDAERIHFAGKPLDVKIKEFSFLNFASDANIRTGTGASTGLSLSGSTKPFKITRTNQNFLLSFTLSVETSNNLRLDELEPSQVFLRVLTPEQDWMKMIPSDEEFGTGRGRTYRLQLNFGNDRSFKNFVSLGSVELIIGDAMFGGNTKVFSLGELDFTDFRNEYKPSIEEEKYWKVPVIDHLFHAEEIRATPIMANVFSGLVFFPFVIFFLGMLKFLGGVRIPSGVVFHMALFGSIGGSLVVIAMFWIEFTVFQAFFWLLLCFAIGGILGSRALRISYQARTKRE